jgi:hypothetical protein
MGGWPYCFGACDKAAYHGRECVVWQNYSPHGGQEVQEKCQCPNIPFKGMPSVTSPSTRSYLVVVPPLPNNTMGRRPGLQHMALWKILRFQTMMPDI